DDLNKIINTTGEVIDKAIELCLYCMKKQIFLDGNKRAAIIFACHFLIANGSGLLVIPKNHVNKFKKMLINYYEGKGEDKIKSFMKDKCWQKF
ncbi:MAG: Fic family protein, partial [Acidaminococcaceae bacterium]|nr:Fic family protein [Acidaminococcaceae bacterium]